MNISEIENHVRNYYYKNNPKENVYHNIDHVIEVVEMVKVISSESKISEKEINQLLVAAWLHDIGHIKIWDDHEELSAKYAEQYMHTCHCNEKDIKTVVGCILATKIPHNPKNILEEIICDADVSHIGSEDFFDKSILLKKEMEFRKNKKYLEKDWLKKNLDFLNETFFFTEFCKKEFNHQRDVNIIKFQKYLNQL